MPPLQTVSLSLYSPIGDPIHPLYVHIIEPLYHRALA